MNVAVRALCCIKTCRQALENSCGLLSQEIACILCGVEAYQDSLYEALQSTRCYPVKKCKVHVQLSEKHECKATYLTCASEAILGNSDHDLTHSVVVIDCKKFTRRDSTEIRDFVPVSYHLE